MSNAADLKTRTVKELTELARKRKVHGWHAMRKDELVRALKRQAKRAAAKRATLTGRGNGLPKTNGVPKTAGLAKANGNGKTTREVKGSRGVKVHDGAKNGFAKNGHAKNGHAKNGHTGSNGHATNGSGAQTVKVHLGNGQNNSGGRADPAAHGHNGNFATLQETEKLALLREKAQIEKGPQPLSPLAERRLHEIKNRLAEVKDLAFHAVKEGRNGRDRLVVMVRDPYWLHAYWELGRRSVQRAEVAMGQYWHAAHPVLRLHEVSRNGTTSAARKAVRDIEIHGGVNNWYIDVQNPPKAYQIEIGYLAPGNRFYCLARSNVVSTPTPGSADTFDRNWAEVAKECDRVYAMTAGSTEQDANGDLKDVFEEHMHRPMGESLLTQFGPGACGAKQDFRFQIDTELIVHGVTRPDARVTLRGEPVRLRPDGSFAVRFSLPDRRHVLPVVANSGDGAEQRTIVLAIDRNTKVMEPVLRDPGE